jgi:thioredoxin reductase (NADPH)
MLEAIELENTETREPRVVETPAIFSMIGAKPCTDWLPTQIERDGKGFIKTGPAVADAWAWKSSARPPGPARDQLPRHFRGGRCALRLGETVAPLL